MPHFEVPPRMEAHRRGSASGCKASLTLPGEIERLCAFLAFASREFGKNEVSRFELFQFAHVDTPRLRKPILIWMSMYSFKRAGGPNPQVEA